MADGLQLTGSHVDHHACSFTVVQVGILRAGFRSWGVSFRLRMFASLCDGRTSIWTPTLQWSQNKLLLERLYARLAVGFTSLLPDESWSEFLADSSIAEFSWASFWLGGIKFKSWAWLDRTLRSSGQLAEIIINQEGTSRAWCNFPSPPLSLGPIANCMRSWQNLHFWATLYLLEWLRQSVQFSIVLHVPVPVQEVCGTL